MSHCSYRNMLTQMLISQFHACPWMTGIYIYYLTALSHVVQWKPYIGWCVWRSKSTIGFNSSIPINESVLHSNLLTFFFWFCIALLLQSSVRFWTDENWQHWTCYSICRETKGLWTEGNGCSTYPSSSICYFPKSSKDSLLQVSVNFISVGALHPFT